MQTAGGGSATCDFDNVVIYTESFPSGPLSNPPAVPPPTSTAGAADVAVISYANPPFYYHLNDHLGSTRIITNGAGTVTGSFEYYPFGEVKSSTGCAANPQRFTGKLFDNESALQYFGARYLSNDLTKFTSVDPARESFDPEDPQSWNRYAYSKNDPTNRIDPDGEWSVLGWLVQRARGMGLNKVKSLSRDALKREVRKHKNKDFLVTSKKMARKLSKEKGKKTTHHQPHTKDGKKGYPHYHPEDGEHIFYKPVAGTPAMINWDKLKEEFSADEESEQTQETEQETENDESGEETEASEPSYEEELSRELYGEPTCEGDCPPN